MTKTLVAGQNTPLPQHIVRCLLPGARSAALLLDDRSHAPNAAWFLIEGSTDVAGVQVSASGTLDIRVDDLPVDVHKVLCIALDAPTHKPIACVLQTGAEDFAFTIDRADLHPALICFEVYRRGSDWKIRAVGQGYSGGVAELLRAQHSSALLTTPRVAAEQPPTPPPPPLGDTDPLQRISMIHEDAARITAALLSAKSFADTRLDAEMSAALANPGTRNSPQAQQDIAIAHRRHEDLTARAALDYDRDAAHLTAELTDLDPQLPAALAPWSSTAWRSRVTAAANGIRVGSVTRSDVGPLQIPVCLPAPLHRPLWLDTDTGAQASAPVLGALVLRLLAAARGTTMEVFDAGGSLDFLWDLLVAHMPRPAVTTSADLVGRLQQLVHDVDLDGLRHIADDSPAAARVVVITDFGYATTERAAELTAMLLNKSDNAALSVIFTGDPDWARAGPTPLQRAIAQGSVHIPVDSAAVQLDRWTQTPWQFSAETISVGDQLVQASSALLDFR